MRKLLYAIRKITIPTFFFGLGMIISKTTSTKLVIAYILLMLLFIFMYDYLAAYEERMRKHGKGNRSM